MASGVRIKGLRELQRDFKKMSKELDKNLTDRLKQAAEPVSAEASRLALGRISNMPGSPRWAGMRVGVSRARGSVYIFPSARRRGGTGRPNLGRLLLEQAMDPAVDAKQQDVVRGIEDMLDDMANQHGF